MLPLVLREQSIRHCGSPHRQQQGYDELRDNYLARFGIRVLRVATHAVRDDLASVICAIGDALRIRP
jgi:very-short-patch-repair endonuclease